MVRPCWRALNEHHTHKKKKKKRWRSSEIAALPNRVLSRLFLLVHSSLRYSTVYTQSRYFPFTIQC